MKKLTTLSTAAMLAIFLTACDDKASNDAASTEKPTTEQTQATAPKVDTGEQDYKAFRQWQAEQEKALNVAMDEAMKKLGSNPDPKLAEETMNKVWLDQINAIKESAAQLNLQDEKVNALKQKSLEAIEIGLKMTEEGKKVAENPSEETHKAFSELQAQLMQIAEEGQKLEAELVQKYEPAPPVAQPVAEQPASAAEAPKQ